MTTVQQDPPWEWAVVGWVTKDVYASEAEEMRDAQGHSRFVAAMHPMATALAEVGYHSEFIGPGDHDRYCHGLAFDHPYPNDTVLIKAARLCGVGDLVTALIDHRAEVATGYWL